MAAKEGLLAEYASLRQEILKRQDARLATLGYSVTAVGAVIGFSFKPAPQGAQMFDYFAFVLTGFAFVVIIGALLLTVQNTQQMDALAKYIREAVEPGLGMGWETWWARYRKSYGMRLGTSRALALYYAVLTTGIYGVTLLAGLYLYLPALLILTALAVVSLAFCFDLSERKSRAWAFRWDRAKDEASHMAEQR